MDTDISKLKCVKIIQPRRYLSKQYILNYNNFWSSWPSIIHKDFLYVGCTDKNLKNDQKDQIYLVRCYYILAGVTGEYCVFIGKRFEPLSGFSRVHPTCGYK